LRNSRRADKAEIWFWKPGGLLIRPTAWSPHSETYHPAIWGKNVLDKHYLNQASPAAAPARLRCAAPYGVSMSFNYQGPRPWRGCNNSP
jgi:hypothetical protein